MQARHAPLPVALGVCAILVATAGILMLRSLALAGDGSWYLLQILGGAGVFGPDPRFLSNAVRQAPVLAAADTGLTNTYVLTLFFGFGQLVVPALVWAAAVLLSRADGAAFAAVSMTAGLCAASTWFFSVSETVLAVPLTVLVAVLLWLPRDWGWVDVGLAAAASLVLVASYETAALTGAILGVWAAWRAARATGRVDRAGSAFVSAASFASVGVGVVGSQHTTGRPSGDAFLYHLVSLEPWPLFVALCGVWLLVGGLLLPARGPRRFTLVLGALAVVVGALAQETTNGHAYDARSGTTLAGIVLVLFLWWRWIAARRGHPRAVAEPGNVAPMLTIVVVALLVAPTLAASRSWARSLDAFREAVTTTDGVVVVEDVLPADRRQVLFDWTSSSLSLIVRGSPTDGVLVDRRPSLVPFAPDDARGQLSDEFVWAE